MVSTLAVRAGVGAPSVSSSFAGVDVSRDHLDLFVRGSLKCAAKAGRGGGKPRRFANDAPGIRSLLASLAGEAPTVVAVESTGGYERALLHAMIDASVPVAHVNPLNVRHYARGMGQLAKTDSIDAKVLAEYAQTAHTQGRLRLLDGSRDKIRLMLKELITRRRQLIDVGIMQKNQLHQASLPEVKKSIQAVLKVVCKQIKAVDEQIQERIDADAELKRRYENLLSVSGIGKTVARVLVSELPELGTINRKKIASLVGVAPMNDDSGTITGRRMIRGGRHTVRCALYMATLVGTRHNEVIRAKYRALVERGKPKKVALIACLRGLLGYLSSVVNQPVDGTNKMHDAQRSETQSPARDGGEKE